MEIQQSITSCSVSYLRGGPPLKLCLLKTLGLHSHALLYGRASVGQIRVLLSVCQHGEEEGSRIRESSQPAAPSSASPCVSRSPGSFLPAPQQPQSQGASVRGGWEVLRGLKRTWNGEQSTSSSYMSDCSQWTCYSWSLSPPPVFSQCMCVGVYVVFFVCVCVFSSQCWLLSVLCVKRESLPSPLMLPVAPRC